MTAPPLAVYVHWPFCLSKCPYCDFNSHVRESVDQARWQSALLRELDTAADETPGRVVTSLFFGGGTPSLMPAATAAAVIDRAADRWTLADDVEISLEANPTSVESGRLAAFRSAGVNRVSLGVQSLDDTALRFLGRGHDAAEALSALTTARALFDRVSFDLIYARPGQTPEAWRRELDQGLTLAADHLSLYQLTIEPGTAFHNRARRGEALAAPEPVAARLYELTQAMLADAGLPAYEISNHARPGAECRHNLTYWRYQDYLGIGPGAHGRVTGPGGKLATRRVRGPEEWLDAVERDGDGMAERAPLDADARFTELLVMGLRLREGVPVERIRQETGTPVSTWISDSRRQELVAGGFLDADPERLRATAAGRQRLDAVIAHLIA